MAGASRIEWTEQTWNPTTGCTKVSPGCTHCYAEVMARRLAAMKAPGYERGFGLALHPERLEQPLRRRKPTVYFVNSMSDLFHKDVPDVFLEEVFSIIQRTPQHTYQLLTKRASRLPRYFAKRACPPNVWLGVSVENRRNGLPRIEELRKVHADPNLVIEEAGKVNFGGIDWVIVGGESGHQARPMKPEWVKSIKTQCDRQRVPFFFKQWGKFGPDGVGRGKGANGRILLGKTWDGLPAAASLG